jgi:hypothetical protein
MQSIFSYFAGPVRTRPGMAFAVAAEHQDGGQHALHRALEDLAGQDDGTRLAERLHRYRRLGMPPIG